jgi:Leucine-rich repeat (LRR) protein
MQLTASGHPSQQDKSIKIPSSINILSKLQIFQLSQVFFFGIIPNMGNMSSLLEFGIHDNHFHGTIPSSLGDIQSLQYLDFASNNFSGIIPHELCSANALYVNITNTNIHCYDGCLTTATIFIKDLSLHNLHLDQFSDYIFMHTIYTIHHPFYEYGIRIIKLIIYLKIYIFYTKKVNN